MLGSWLRIMSLVSLSHVENVVVECSTLFICVCVVPGSNVGPLTGYPEWQFLLLAPVPVSECRSCTCLASNCGSFLPHPVQLHVTASILGSVCFDTFWAAGGILRVEKTTPELCGFLGDEFVDFGFLRCDVIWPCRWVATFWKNVLPPR
jgi:hypothetical protein